jgi:DHA3 family macrolide efflux protein-like MFS transporter
MSVSNSIDSTQPNDNHNIGIKDVLRIRDFRFLWLGQIISNFGDSLTGLAVLLLINKLTGGSTSAIALGAIVQAVPQLAFGLLAGVYVDRLDRKRIMIISDILRGITVLCLTLVVSSEQLWLLYAIGFIQASISAFFAPARTAYTALIVPKNGLLSANSLSQTSRITASVLGVAAAGGLIGALDIYWPVFVIDSLTFFISALFISRIASKSRLSEVEAAKGASAIFNQLKAGLSLVFSSRLLSGTVVAMGVTMLGLGAVNVLLVPFVVNDLQIPETWFAALEGSQTLSMILSGTLVAALAARFKPTNVVSVGLGLLGIAVGLISIASGVWGLMLIFFILGWFLTPVQASLVTLIQTNVTDDVRGRASAALSTMMQASNVTSMALAGLVADWIGVRQVFFLSGLITAAAGVISAWVFKGYREKKVDLVPAVEPARNQPEV